MFKIVSSKIDVHILLRNLNSRQAGALVTFEGRVRDNQNNLNVDRLSYHSYEALANKEGHRVISEALEKYDVIEIQALHRQGDLEIGDVAVWIGVLSAHRKDAFTACQYLIDNIKNRLPIWKKEFYSDGKIEWVENSHNTNQNIEFDEYYAKQLLLPDVGTKGQGCLTRARVAVIGAGGIGCPVLMNLACAGVGHIGIFDDDKVEISNLHRQTIYTVDDIGKNKAITAMQKLKEHNPLIDIQAHKIRISGSESSDLLKDYNIIVDGTDNLTTKYYLNKVCYMMGIPLVIAAVHHWQAVLHTFFTEGSTGCFQCLSEEIPSDEIVKGCTDSGIMGVVPAIIGSLAANEVIRLLFGYHPQSSTDGILLDMRTLLMQRIKRKRRNGCAICQGNDISKRIISSDSVSQINDYEIEIDKFNSLKNKFVMVDIRTGNEKLFNENLLGSWSQFRENEINELKGLPKGKKYMLVCEKGQASRLMAKQLRSDGLHNYFSLVGGIKALIHSNEF